MKRGWKAWRFSRRWPRWNVAFTLVEMLTVLAVIVVLAGLVVAIVAYAPTRDSRHRVEAEIQALSAAIESYKADHGAYPRSDATDGLDPRRHGDPQDGRYLKAFADLYELLSGDANRNFRRDGDEGKNHFDFENRPHMLKLDKDRQPGTQDYVKYIQDPFGYSYGYSTAWQKDYEARKQAKPDEDPEPAQGYNPTFDLWSTGGTKAKSATVPSPQKWIKNW